MHKGSCLCGAVSFEFQGDLAAPNGCHCHQCRKQTGHYLVSMDVDRAKLTILGEQSLTWFQSSDQVRRGFCSVCGSTLFWDPIFQPQTAIAMGCFDTPTDVHIGLHIFVADKHDYYEIIDGLPRTSTDMPGSGRLGRSHVYERIMNFPMQPAHSGLTELSVVSASKTFI